LKTIGEVTKSQRTKSGTFARHTKPTHEKPTLQKSLPCANAQATLCGWTQSHIVDDRGEGRTYNKAVWQYGGATNMFSTFFRYWAFVPADE
jgi:hypothetical protein